MSTNAPHRLRSARVLLALQGTQPGPASFATATVLARALGAELTALFVEDIELLRLAALPFTREIGLSSGLVRPIEVLDLERALRRQAEQMRTALARAAAELALPWSFHVARGRLLEQVLETAQATDLVVLARRQPASSRASGSLPVAQTEHGIAVLFDASESGLRALGAALELAGGQPEQLTLLVPAAAASELAKFQRSAAAALGVGVEPARLQPIAAPEAGELARIARQRRASALVLAQSSLRDAAGQLRVLLEVVHCPLVLVR